MKTSGCLRAALPLPLLLWATVGATARAAARSDDPLSLVPAGAASVAVIHLDQLRASPLAERLFSDTDRMTAGGDAGRFLADAHLSPKKDVDTVVVAGLPALDGKSDVLVVVTGRFDPDELAKAVEARGARRVSSPAGDYERLPQKSDEDKKGAVSFVSRSLVIAGTEPAVIDALAARQKGGTGFASASGLGRQLSRVSRGAAVWVLVDVARYPALQKRAGRGHDEGERGGEPAAALFSAMKSVSLFAAEATPRGDGLELSATGLVSDAETRQLLEDSVRGLLAMWRLAVQDKSPELVSALRKFQVGNDAGAVTIRGTLPGSVLRTLAEKHRKAQED